MQNLSRKIVIAGLTKAIFVDKYGNILGRHKGITHYTVGQRKGLNGTRSSGVRDGDPSGDERGCDRGKEDVFSNQPDLPEPQLDGD